MKDLESVTTIKHQRNCFMLNSYDCRTLNLVLGIVRETMISQNSSFLGPLELQSVLLHHFQQRKNSG